MTVRLVELDAAQLAQRVDDVLDVYAEAMEVPPAAARSRRSIVAAHVQRRGLRAILALDGEQVVGVAYGYRGEPGQWWHDQVHEALTPEQAAQWLDGAFEVCELHVRPAQQGTGLGRDLLTALLDGLPARTAVLTTPDSETRARRFYRDGGWVDLRRDLRFPGDPRTFAVLGLRLGSQP
jgi:ribosomal protein S18 acetylase RimI-like enzyme